jgi:EmrB/QacA subfamily drug resistance transporter
MLIFALMLVLLLAALDQSIVATALPTIAGDVGRLASLPWIVTAYMLTTTLVTPIYGKLGDLFGRRATLQSAVVLFLLGSVLCGFSQTVAQLVAFRALQGLGGGGLYVTIYAATGDLFSPRERGRYQGWFGAVFAFATIVGPLLGGIFVQDLSWRWIFFVNLPVGLVALWIVRRSFPLHPMTAAPSIDYAGAALLGVGLTMIVFAFSTGIGMLRPAWTAGVAVAAVLALSGFVVVEANAREPLLPLFLFSNRVFTASCAIGLIMGLALYGSVALMPVYLQVVRGATPQMAGLELTPMMGGVLITSMASGRAISRLGRYKPFPVAGTAVAAIALLGLSTLNTASPVWLPSCFVLLLGLGLGLEMQALVLAAQNAVPHHHIGVATSGATLFRSIGGVLGMALSGDVFAYGLDPHLAHSLIRGSQLPTVAAPTARLAYQTSVALALHPVFRIAMCFAVLAFMLTFTLKEIPLRTAAGDETVENLGGTPASPAA